MRSTASVLMTIGLLMLGVVRSAQGATFATPMVGVNGVPQYMDCAVNNVGTKPITVTVTLIGTDGNTLTPIDTTCGAPIAPKGECDSLGPFGASGYCMVTSPSSTVRVDVQVFDQSTGAVMVLVPGTK